MSRILFIILALGFALQCSGMADCVLKPANETEQCAGDTQSGEESQQDEVKKDNNQFNIGLPYSLSAFRRALEGTFNNDFFPVGYSSKPYLPPRR